MYVIALLGCLVGGSAMLLLVNEMFPSPTDADLKRVEFDDGPTRAIQRPAIQRRPVNDYEGSVGQMVARGRRMGGSAVRGVYRGVAHVARHARRQGWERPSDFVRRHAHKGHRYHDTVSSCVPNPFFYGHGQNWEVGRHSIEHINMITELEAMLAREPEGVRA